MLTLLAACQTTTPPLPATDTAAVIETGPASEALAAPALARRLSLDLRGVVLTEDELSRVEADPAAVDDLLDEFLADPRLEERLVALLAERWLTRTDTFNLTPGSYGLSETLAEYDFARSIGQEPLRLAAWIISQDRPWTDLVTTADARADEVLAQIWPMEYPEGATGWQTSRYTDGRPAAGVLVSNGLWWRYDTSPSNVNRHRAAAISRLLLCEDFLTRPVDFSNPDLVGEGAIDDAIRESPGCVSCHSTLDPLSSALFGFWWFDRYDTTELTYYHSEREQLGAYYLGTTPAWFGTPVDSTAHLGELVAADDRFRRCGARTTAELLWRRSVTIDDFDTLEAIDVAAAADGYQGHALLRAVVATDVYQAGALTRAATEDDADRLPTRRMMSAALMASAVTDLTGFSWEVDGVDMLDNDRVGYRVLAGGVDGDTITRPLLTPSLPRSSVAKRLAQASAAVVVAEDLVGGGTLLMGVTAETDPSDPAFEAALIALHRRVHGVTPTDDDLDEDIALWEAVTAQSDSTQGWTSLVSVLLREPRFWIY